MDAGLHQILGSEPTPEFAAMFQENCQVLLDLLQEETLRTVAVLRLQGYSNAEIAAAFALRPVNQPACGVRG